MGDAVMDAYAAFEAGREEIRAQLEAARDANEAASLAMAALERIACALAQDETDEMARQRQQAVMALAKRAPLCLRAARAWGQLIVEEAPVQAAQGERLSRGLRLAGLCLLGVLAAAQAIGGQLLPAALELAGGALLFAGVMRGAGAQPQQKMRAEGILKADAAELLRAMGELCQAADICVSDLQLLERDGAQARIVGTADDVTLDLLVSLLEAQATGRGDVALARLDQVRTTLKLMGIEAVEYAADDPECARMFDVLPTLGKMRTVRPALIRDGVLLRRGVAVCAVAQAR